jgi:multicomponent Na+:H+ antiporter subunit E
MIRKFLLKIYHIIGFLLFYIVEVIIANMRIAWDIITPRHRMKPGVLAIPLDVETDNEILALNNLITMTPGTLSLDVSTDKRVIYVHAMYIDDAEKIRKEIKSGLEKRIMEVMSR